MRVSLNEVETTVLKAARGAGYAWGLAEDMVRAARWLAGNDLPWLKTAPAVLAETVVALLADGRPLENPIAAGAYHADLASTGLVRDLPTVRVPLWYAGLIACATGVHGDAVSVGWLVSDTRARIDVAGGQLLLAEGPLGADDGRQVTVTRLDVHHRNVGRPARPVVGYDADERVWSVLADYEKRTYVPASELSRREGAGAGLVDND